jgi:type IV secretion system protein TrbL
MDDLNVIDQFTETFSSYIETGFGLLSPDVGFLTAILIGIDITLAGLLWALNGENNVLAAFLKKILYVGFFALVLNNFAFLADVVFGSFGGLGLAASGTTLTADDLLHPGFIAAAGYAAGHPLLESIGALVGPIAFFENFVVIVVLFAAWFIVLAAFFILAVQLFITIIEFKLTTLAGFVLVPFALWRGSAFLAERVLGNVITSGVKLMVLAVIVGIGSTLFGSIVAAFTPGEVTLEQAVSVILASFAILGLGVFGPGVANGLVAGAPQLGAGAAVGTLAGTAAAGVVAGSLAAGAARTAGGVAAGAVRAGASMSGTAAAGYGLGRAASGKSGLGGVAAGVAGAARSSGAALAARLRASAGRALGSPRGAFEAGGREAVAATGGRLGREPLASAGPGGTPAWARRLRAEQHLREAGMIAAHTIREGDRGGSSEGPDLKERGA